MATAMATAAVDTPVVHAHANAHANAHAAADAATLSYKLPQTSTPSFQVGDALICVFTNVGYMPFTTNFMLQLSRLGATWRPFVLCADEAAAAECGRRTWLHDVVKPKGVSAPVSRDFLPFTAREYAPLTFQKLAGIACLLDFGARIGARRVVYFDTDVGLRADPLPILAALHAAAPGADVLAQCDERAMPACTRDLGSARCAELCTGVMSIRINDRTRALFDFSHGNKLARGAVGAYQGDQGYINEAIKRGDAVGESLPRHLFPNGRFLGGGGANAPAPADVQHAAAAAATLPSTAVLVHYNWMVGDVKARRMEVDGYWLAGPTPTHSSEALN